MIITPSIIQPVLAVENLSARYGSTSVFSHLGFSLAPGGAVLVTGGNGSGKSTLLRVLAGLHPYNAGLTTWQGQPTDLCGGQHRQRMCYIGHLDALKPELTVVDQLEYWRALNPSLAANNALDLFALGSLAGRPVRTLSAGQKRRLSLSRLAMKPAMLWLLDEPATALDAAGLALLEQAIAAHRADGGMAIMATHQNLRLYNTVTIAMADYAAHQTAPTRRDEELLAL